jgi:predicted AAA+ superfamily ATPase
MVKDVIKFIIANKQSEMPFNLIERDIKIPTEENKIITIPGIRRCGKTTMMELAVNQLLKDGVSKTRILWIGFDDERLAGMSTDELDDIISSYMEMFPEISINETYMFFDEIQLIKDWEYFVLRLYKSYCKHIFVCGSNATMLSTEVVSALRGYPLEYKTFPLSFHEYLRFSGIDGTSHLESDIAKIKAAFDDYNNFGGFPEVTLAKSESRKIELLQNYFTAMLYRDLVEHYKISNVSVVNYFIKRLLANIPKPTSINKIFNDLKSQGFKVSKNDLYLWSDYICNIFLFLRIPKYSKSLAQRQSGLKKYYCMDNGIHSSILLPQSNDNGTKLENTIFLQLCRIRSSVEEIYYFQDGKECDFVLEDRGKIKNLIQVSWSINNSETKEREVSGLLKASQATNCDDMTIITHDEEATLRHGDKSIKVVPAWKWLLGRM